MSFTALRGVQEVVEVVMGWGARGGEEDWVLTGYPSAAFSARGGEAFLFLSFGGAMGGGCASAYACVVR